MCLPARIFSLIHGIYIGAKNVFNNDARKFKQILYGISHLTVEIIKQKAAKSPPLVRYTCIA
jgi:hypothetical protein